ncbi:uncharacterized protein LOC110238542 [Exaiptasia diaphana]|uniref:THAP-type domain-containing protein n=1 Tax=Exaiptasia diaphana TaxID=2652724 RepID=A0A913X806_EXADI|nr:uncharacterized protein LOC110238542 [Exaiptasia diaphana]
MLEDIQSRESERSVARAFFCETESRLYIHCYCNFFKMPTLCAVYNCGHNNIRDIEYSFYRIPKIIRHQGEQTQKLSTERREQWLKNINRDRKDLTEKKIDGTRVCSAHFVSGKPATLEDKSNIDWAPTVNMGHSYIKKHSTKGAEREKRAAKRGLNALNPTKIVKRKVARREGEPEVVAAVSKSKSDDKNLLCSEFSSQGSTGQPEESFLFQDNLGKTLC